VTTIPGVQNTLNKNAPGVGKNELWLFSVVELCRALAFARLLQLLSLALFNTFCRMSIILQIQDFGIFIADLDLYRCW